MKISKETENALLKAVNATCVADWKPHIFGYERIGEFVLFAVCEKFTDFCDDEENESQNRSLFSATLYEVFAPGGKLPAVLDDAEYVAEADDPHVCNSEVYRRLNLRALRLYRMYNGRGLVG